MDSDGPAYKAVIIGDSGCGKTALVIRWTQNIFSQVGRPTIGSNHERKQVNLPDSSVITLCVWDTAGQEQFHALVPLYARASAVAIITAAANDAASFKSIPAWIECLKIACPVTPPLILAVNKVDLDSRKELVSQVEAEHASQFDAIFFVSALTGQGVADLFDTAGIHAARFAEAHATTAEQLSLVKTPSRCC
jgi:small GTP-binding protein